jgi:site-specific DNA recombinase
VPQLARALADQRIYVAESRFGMARTKARPLYRRMKRDAAKRKFDRLLVWNVSQLGRNMRDVIHTVYELAKHGVTVYPVKSQTGPINSTMGKRLWAIRVWYAEMENEERSEAGQAGLAGAKSARKLAGRPRVIVDRDEVVRLRDGERRS